MIPQDMPPAFSRQAEAMDGKRKKQSGKKKKKEGGKGHSP